jgi:hypothetical protein
MYVLLYSPDDNLHEELRTVIGPFRDMQAAMGFMIHCVNCSICFTLKEVPPGVPIVSYEMAERLYDEHVAGGGSKWPGLN